MIHKIIILLLAFLAANTYPQIYPDQHYVINVDSIFKNIETNVGIKLSEDGKFLMLQDSSTSGYIIIRPQYSKFPFNEGLPSWNGTASDNNGFKVQMRFPYGSGWSPWLTVGFWKSNIWSSYGSTSYGGGYIDYDTAKLLSYQSRWQFKILMLRSSISVLSPTLHKLSFFVSDSRTTTSQNYNQILNDNPEEIFIPTKFIYQFGVDPQIGPSICSPTSVSMIINSFGIEVAPYQFALDTYDPYFKMFGIWPRVVQNASEYGLDGAVTRYRSWSNVREVLANGGRISMSIGQPLYTGHLVMLAGFTHDGRPIVHDPARSDGYSQVYSKSDISHSWFDKGGVAYTFYNPDSISVFLEITNGTNSLLNDFKLYQNYPNPFNPNTNIQVFIPSKQFISLKVYDVLGNEVTEIINQEMNSGNFIFRFDGDNLSSGVYLYKLQAGNFTETKKMILIK